MVVTSVMAQPRVVGVSVGDWFKYGDITVNWSSDDPNATSPHLVWNVTEWMSISVEDVSGTNITFQSTWRYINGTEETPRGHIDIDTGDGNMTFSAISANLNANDTIYSTSTMKIDETIIRTYPDSTRDTNHLNTTTESNVTGFYQYLSMNLYWDRSSGISVETALESTIQAEGYTTTMSILVRITESNVWVVPEFPSYLLLPLFTISTLRRKHSM